MKDQTIEKTIPKGALDGTPSPGGSSQEDPPSGGSSGSGNSNQRLSPDSTDTICDFNIHRQEVNKKKSPIFQNFEGNVHLYTPYLSTQNTLNGDKTVEYKMHVRPGDKNQIDINPDVINKVEKTLINAYMSELIFLYQDPEPDATESNTENKYHIHKVEHPNNHILLSQTIWFLPNRLPGRNRKTVLIDQNAWGEVEREQYIVHDFRPVYKLDQWASEENTTTQDRKIDTIAKNITNNDFIEGYNEDKTFWLVVVRPNKDALKAYSNRYGMGIVSIPKDAAVPVPQINQDVKVYGYHEDETDVSDRLTIKSGNIPSPRATIEIVPCIELCNPLK